MFSVVICAASAQGFSSRNSWWKNVLFLLCFYCVFCVDYQQILSVSVVFHWAAAGCSFMLEDVDRKTCFLGEESEISAEMLSSNEEASRLGGAALKHLWSIVLIDGFVCKAGDTWRRGW